MMNKRPLIAYYAIAIAISVGLGVLLNVSLVFGLLALFGPAVAAFVVARTTEGRHGTLWRSTTRWRVHPGWYAAAILVPIGGYGLAHLAYVMAGNAPLPLPGPIQPISLVLFFLVIGEEIGWRAFLLSGLLKTRTPLVATALVAAAWALWHSPLYFVPGMPSYGQPYLAFVAWLIPSSFMLTWLWLGTRSAWLATIMHGSLNLGAAIAFPLAEPGTLFAFSAIGMSVVAVGLAATSWKRLVAPPEATAPFSTAAAPSS
jgi:membrane protease YdiL (CAAX protease family)